MSFLCYLSGAVVGGHQWGISHHSSSSAVDRTGHERFDGMLSQRALRISQVTEYHAESTGGLCGERLEKSSLYFQVNFRKTYLSDPPPSSAQVGGC